MTPTHWTCHGELASQCPCWMISFNFTFSLLILSLRMVVVSDSIDLWMHIFSFCPLLHPRVTVDARPGSLHPRPSWFRCQCPGQNPSGAVPRRTKQQHNRSHSRWLVFSSTSCWAHYPFRRLQVLCVSGGNAIHGNLIGYVHRME